LDAEKVGVVAYNDRATITSFFSIGGSYMNQSPLQLSFNLTIPKESMDTLFDFIKRCLPLPQLEPQAKRLLPDAKSEEGTLLMDVRQASKMLNISQRSIHRMYRNKLMPEPVRLTGGFLLWNRLELISWVDHRCQPQSEWKYPLQTNDE
jgi:predicted DNA-binding transcriptional regulator AlpA